MAKSRTIKANLFRAFENAQQPIYLLNAEREIEFANHALAQWVGATPESITTWTCNYHSQPDRSSESAYKRSERCANNHREPADVDAAQAKASRLCPPPECFRQETPTCGQISARVAGTVQFREATFHRLLIEDSASDQTAILVIAEPMVAPAPTPTETTETTERDPLDLHNLLQIVQEQIGAAAGFEPLLGNSPQSRRLQWQANELARTQTNYCITGPLGSGRRQVAETIHLATRQNHSPQQSEEVPVLIPLDARICDSEFLQSTFREYLGPSRFIDGIEPRLLLLEADQLSPAGQLELRSFLEIPTFQLRVTSTSCQSLLDLASRDEYDEELAIRLAVFELQLPSLSDRNNDLPLMAQALIEQLNAGGGKQIAGLNPHAMQLLQQYHWPHEFRELRETIQAAFAAATGTKIVKDDLPKRLHQAEFASQHASRTDDLCIELNGFLAKIEAELIHRALQISAGNKAEAARRLGISRASLLRRLKQNKPGSAEK